MAESSDLEAIKTIVVDQSAEIDTLKATIATQEEKIVAMTGEICEPQSEHECYCASQGKVHPIIIHEDDDGNVSVKLFDKSFGEDEIERLKTINGESDLTSYEIFLTLDAITRACEHEIHTQSTDGYYSSHSNDSNGEYSGAEFYKTPTEYEIWTSWKGFHHGW